jgi:hypothetical protein
VLFGRPLVFVTPDFGAFLGSGGVYATRNTPLPSLLALRNQPSGAVASPFQRTGPIESFQIVEASRREIPLGEERRVIDNSQSSSMTSHTIRLTKEWTRSYTLDLTTATSGQVSGGFAAGFVALKAAAERAVSSRYSASIQERQSFEEEVTVSSAAHTHSEIFFSWKQVRQRGKVVVRSQGGSVEIPFEVVIGVTFDQRQVDVPATRRRT